MKRVPKTILLESEKDCKRVMAVSFIKLLGAGVIVSKLIQKKMSDEEYEAMSKEERTIFILKEYAKAAAAGFGLGKIFNWGRDYGTSQYILNEFKAEE